MHHCLNGEKMSLLNDIARPHSMQNTYGNTLIAIPGNAPDGRPV